MTAIEVTNVLLFIIVIYGILGTFSLSQIVNLLKNKDKP